MDTHSLLFFLDEFHSGAFNHITHYAGFTVLGYGLGVRSWLLVALSPVLMEFGHVYNYMHGVHSELALTILPKQLAFWLVFVGVGYLCARVYRAKYAH